MHSWFWREGFRTQDPQAIADAYHACRQRHASLLLNLSPDTTGGLPEEAVATLQQAARLIRKQ